MKTRIDWPSIDWSKYDAAIAAELGVSATVVGRWRKVCSKIESTKRMTIELDEDGYPTTLSLKHIAGWEHAWGYGLLMEKIRKVWRYDTWQENEEAVHNALVTAYYISTMGWSGNESIISALRENCLFWALCWNQSTKGGHYVFRVPV